MSYCVNCGVELNPGAALCPLCGTPAWKPKKDAAPYFPTRPAVIDPAPRRTAALILSSMLASVVVCCGLLNLVFIPDKPWSLYIIGAAVMLFIWFVLPLCLRLPLPLRLSLDVIAVGIYVWLISLSVGGGVWFRGLAMPILGLICVLVFLLSLLLRGGRHSRLTVLSLSIGAAGLLLLGVEYFVNRYAHGVWAPGWSLVTSAVCVALIIPLRVIRRVPALRAEVRRRFNF